MDKSFEEKKLRKMYVRQNQLTLIKHARKIHGEYIVNTTEECDAQYNRKCVHAVINTLLRAEWEALVIQTLVEFMPLHWWDSENFFPLKYPQMVTLKFDTAKVTFSGQCVLRADPKSYVSDKTVPQLRNLGGRKWIDEKGFVLTENYLEIPGKFIDDNLQGIVQALTKNQPRTWKVGTFNYSQFAVQMPNGNFRFYRENQGEMFAPKENFGVCAKEQHFHRCLVVEVCA